MKQSELVKLINEREVNDSEVKNLIDIYKDFVNNSIGKYIRLIGDNGETFVGKVYSINTSRTDNKLEICLNEYICINTKHTYINAKQTYLMFNNEDDLYFTISELTQP